VLECDTAGGCGLTIEDDGIGLPEGAGVGRYGIVGMRERSLDLGGTFAIGAERGGGTSVRVRVPLAR